MGLWCNATRRGLVGPQLATTWVKITGICFRWLLKLIYWKLLLQECLQLSFSWSTVERIAQASDDIIKVVPKWRIASGNPLPEDARNISRLVCLFIYCNPFGGWSGWSLNLVTSNRNLWLAVYDVMLTSLYGHTVSNSLSRPNLIWWPVPATPFLKILVVTKMTSDTSQRLSHPTSYHNDTTTFAAYVICTLLGGWHAYCLSVCF